MKHKRNHAGIHAVLFAVTIFATLWVSVTSAWALLQPDLALAPVSDFDIRMARNLTPKAVSPEQMILVDALRIQVPDLQVRWSPFTGAPTRLYSRTQALTGPSTQLAVEIALNFLSQNLVLYNLISQDITEVRYPRNFVTRHNGVTHLTLQQQVNGIDVFGGRIRMNLDGEARILNMGGNFLPSVHGAINMAAPVVEAGQARDSAIASAKMTSAKQLGTPALVYFPVTPEELRLAWDVTVEDDHSPNMYRILVDAEDGTVLWRHNLTRYQHGLVYTSDSPSPDTPTGTSDCTPPPTPGPYPLCALDRQDVNFDGGDFFAPADDHHDWWHDGTGNSDVNTTKSNNVHAKLDTDSDNDDTEGFSTVAGGNFSFATDLNEAPSREDATVQNQSSAVVNAFYWINRIHDLYYSLGFDEPSGNFQSDNFGLGGSGGDPVQADVQDSQRRCNAGFSTPGDGSSPRMTLYLCDNSVPWRDSGLENLIVIHEYTHGLSHRLAEFGPYHSQSGGLQDGLCDFMGLAITSEPEDDLRLSYPRGQWYYNDVDGNRRQPYSTDQTVFTRTYGDISDGAVCAQRVCSNNSSTPCDEHADCGAGNTCVATACTFDADCQPPNTTINQGTCNEPPWPAGEIWCNTLWNARANLVWKNGFDSGGRTILQLAVDGLKRALLNPDYLDMRDNILDSDIANNGGANECVLWNAFARMGMGVSASTTGETDIHPVEAFDVPPGCIADIQVDSELSFDNVCVGNSLTNQLRISNNGSGDLIVRRVEKLSGSAEITLGATPQAPVVIVPGAHVDFSVTCAPTSCGTKTATIGIEADDPDEQTVDLIYTCNTDSAPPSITSSPADLTVECDASTDPDQTGRPTATDNCDLTPGITYSDNVIPGAMCPAQSTIQRSWMISDQCGNEVTHVQTIEVVDTTAPSVTCPAGVTIECDQSTDPTNTGSATATDNCDENPLMAYSDAEAPGDCPQEKTISRTWNSTDACGNSSSCVQTIRVVDTTPPVIENVAVSPSSLWAPNHKMVPTTVATTVTDNCDPTPDCSITNVSSSQPVNGLGDGNTAPDWVITGAGTVDLRAERSGKDGGRIYTITVTCTDACGNASVATSTVTVQHNR